MATFKVVVENKITWTGYIEATDSQDAVNKVMYPQIVTAEGDTITGQSGRQTNWEVSSNEKETVIKPLAELETTTVADIPAAVEPE